MRGNGPLLRGETVAVGAVSSSAGSMVAQLAKEAGCEVVGFGSGRERCLQLTRTLGVDGCIDYRNERFDDELSAIFPQSVDVFSDGMGGLFAERLVPLIKPGGRLFCYGAAAAAFAGNASSAPRPTPTIWKHYGITAAVEKILKARDIRSVAWTVDRFYRERLQAEDALSRLLEEGRLRAHNRVVRGFEQLPKAIVDLYHQPRSDKLKISFEQHQEDV